MPLGSKYAGLQQKITLDTSCGKSQTFHCSKVYTLRLSTARVECNFLLQIGILRAKGYNKNVPNVQVCNPTPAPPRTLMSTLVSLIVAQALISAHQGIKYDFLGIT